MAIRAASETASGGSAGRTSGARRPEPSPETPGRFEAVIGLELHIQLGTATKLLCRCRNLTGDEATPDTEAPPNTRVCPVCVGYPGSLPVINGRAVDLALRLALALGCEVAPRSAFDRKSYLYPDLPKGYQITQRRRPLARGGSLPLGAGKRSIPLVGLHLEEDAGKLLETSHPFPSSPSVPTPDPPSPHRPSEAISVPALAVDHNRAGVPLVEVITRPVLRSPAEAKACFRSLHRLVRFLGVGEARLESGGMRADANISLRPHRKDDRAGAGGRVEIKNLSSFRHLAWALEHEIGRQTGLLAAGQPVPDETRGFDPRKRETLPGRIKESAAAYRYTPEPDLPAVVVDEDRLSRARPAPAHLPWRVEERLRHELALNDAEVATLTADPAWVAYLDEALEAGLEGHGNGAGLPAELPTELARWILREVMALAAETGLAPGEVPRALAPERLAEVVLRTLRGEISRRAARPLLEALWGAGTEEPGARETVSAATVSAAIERLGLAQVGDRDRLLGWIDQVLAEHPEEAAALRGGQERLLGFLMGRALARSSGRADPHRVRALLVERLGLDQIDGGPGNEPSPRRGDR